MRVTLTKKFSTSIDRIMSKHPLLNQRICFMFFGLPYRKFTIDSHLNKTEIISRLANSVSDSRRNWQSGETRAKIFEGALSESGFQIKRIIRYRNSFLPIINGTFETHENGTKVLITMKLHPLVLVFLLVWISPLIMIGSVLLLSLIVSMITTGTVDSNLLIIFFALMGMLLFAYLLTINGFMIEANKADRILSELLS